MGAVKLIRQKFWTADSVEAVKKETREYLDSHTEHGRAPDRLALIFSELSAIGDATDSESLLRQFVLTMSALAHHLRHGGLNEREIKRLSESVSNILRLQNIKPGSSRLTHLHSEYRTVMSQVYWHQGHLWQAAWNQQLAAMWAKDVEASREFHFQHAMARRYLRLGYGHAALSFFQQARELAHTDAQKQTAFLSLINATRLTGQQTAAKELVKELIKDFPDAKEDLDVIWERACLRYYETKDCRELLRLTKTGRDHCQSGFIAEARLYAYAGPVQSSINDLPKVATLARRGVLTLANTGAVQAGILALEGCYNHAIPSDVRLDALDAALNKTSEIISLEKEMLLLAAAARWLSRAHVPNLSALVLQRYRALATSITGQLNVDPLGVITDLLERPWTQFEG